MPELQTHVAIPGHNSDKLRLVEGRRRMTKVALVEITDENRASLAEIALSMYLGETCPYCLKKFKTVDDLKTAVYNGYTKHGRIAHGDCFKLAHPEVKS
jgi:hypothetical protein